MIEEEGTGLGVFGKAGGAGFGGAGGEGGTGGVGIVGQVGEFDGGGDGIAANGTDIVKVVHILGVRQQADGLNDFRRKVTRQVLKGHVGVFHNIVQERDASGRLVRHLFGKVEGMKDIRNAATVELSMMGGIGDLHGFEGERGVNHGLLREIYATDGAGAFRDEGRDGLGASGGGAGAPWREGATGREAAGRRDGAGDVLQAGLVEAEGGNRGEETLRVRMARGGENVADGAALDNASGVHDVEALHVVGDDAEIVRDEQDGHVTLGGKLVHHAEDTALGGDVKRGGGFIGNQEARLGGEGHGEHNTLALAAGEAAGIGIGGTGGVRQTNVRQERKDTFAARRAGHRGKSLGDLVADAEDGVEARHRVLEDVGDAAAAGLAQGVRVAQEVTSGEADMPGAVGAIGGREGRDGEGRDGLAAPALADERDAFTGIDVETDAGDGRDLATGRAEGDAEVLNLQ